MASNLARWANCFVPALAWCLLVMPGLFAAAQTIPDIDPSAVRTGLALTSVLFIVLGAAFFAGVVWVARLALWAAASDNRWQFSLLAAGAWHGAPADRC